MKLKRIGAYIIDMIIIYTITNLIFTLPMFEADNRAYAEASQEMVDYIANSGSGEVDQESLNNIIYKVSYSSRISNVIEIAITILYVGIIQFLSNGQTLGKKLLKIKIAPEKGDSLNPSLFILRTVILYGVLFNLISTMGFIIFTKNTAITINSYCSYATLLVNLAIIGTIIFRDDERGLHDLIGNTKVINIKKEN